MCDVTIGIPVYQSESFVRRALESALSQSYPSIEFLIVDDGGDDGSMEIVESIIANHQRGKDVRVIHHQKNYGVSASRNHIIDEAHGEFLYFMDSDDMIAEQTISLMMKNVRQFDADIVLGSYEKVELSGEKFLYQYPALQLLGKDQLASFACRKYAGIQASACNYLVKISLLRRNHLQFMNLSYWEDMVFTYQLSTIVSRAILLPDITYFYYCRRNSLSQYQERAVICRDEILRNVEAIDYLKEYSSSLSEKVYYPGWCYNLVMTDFYIACNVLNKRQSITPSVNDSEIRDFLSHPASFGEVCRFRQFRIKNLMLYYIGKLPPLLCVLIIRFVGKMKKLI